MDNLNLLAQVFLLIWICLLGHMTTESIERNESFVACVNESTLVDLMIYGRDVRASYECFSRCQSIGSKFLGIQTLVSLALIPCICLDEDLEENFFANTSVPFNECNVSCPFNPLLSCGAGMLVSVYKTSARTCEDPGVPVNGSRTGDDFVIGSSVTYNCSSGLEADGPTVSQCWWVDNITLDINWTSPPPACVDPTIVVTNPSSTDPTETTSQMTTILTALPHKDITLPVIIASLAVVVTLVVIIIIVAIVTTRKKRRKRRADISSEPGQSSLPLDKTKAQVQETTPSKKVKDKEGEAESDYLVPDATLVSSTKNTYQGLTLQRVDERPRLPAPPSIKVALTPEETFYQNSLSIALSRSNEKLNKDVKTAPKEVGKHDKGHASKTVSPRHNRSPAGDGAVGKQQAKKTSSLPLPSDGIYQNTQVGTTPNTPRMPPTAPESDDRRASHDLSRQAVQRSSLKHTDSVDYITPNEVNGEEVYENARVMRQHQGPRRPISHTDPNTNVALDAGDSDGVYLDLI
ncbi:uncharacterized protein LOC121431352 [Lytechinus variegatus]|uniref:uncharacterized protein LOC121431352 n=1 Tax=Lytechinus variegatus TaxID=7654 RepID=UPI001BB1ECFC|nr:uncharacterized protein LOC121431352 [Lytechinus variegatus]